MTARRLEDMCGELESSTPFYRALADRIRLLVIDGRIPVGTRLPSERDLAATMGRSRSTVVSTYGLLRETGYTVSALPLAWLFFVLAVTGLSLSVGLIILIGGVLILAATVYVARAPSRPIRVCTRQP